MSTNTSTLSHGHAAHAAAHGHDDHEHHDTGGNTVFGFWVYLMSDCLIFASLFATYVVLAGGTDGGPTAKDLFELPFVAWETALLLTSSLTFGLGMIAMHRKQMGQMYLWLGITAAGLRLHVHGSVGVPASDPSGLRSGPQCLPVGVLRPVGTHGLHVSAGLLWLLVMFVQLKSTA